MPPLWSLLAFMDGGRMADEFEPGLRRVVRADVVALAVLGIVLLILAGVVAVAVAIPWAPVAPLVAGIVFLAAAGILWMRSR